ncbi:NAD(P)/FAD-dependent oxidoreductase [Halobacillus salinarum]|uniref:Ferredoxin--NADP reductase n=1 Tax=Halobacillus salinarum TaxID=2932257 RepID=A0ABY4EKD3_9BACI|nr:NAD(P)/FAD-dependent oxidoreductase [Halobacillus salinarum]UOQ44502.1 NAD(P)/FAD-dependent oxidoreductase [Halobacillus salinarum]
MTDLYDVTIIGAGTTGLYAAFYCGMRDLKTKVIEYQPQTGGKVSFFYPEKAIYDVGGFFGVTGEDLVAGVEEQAVSVQPEFVTGEKIESIVTNTDGTFLLKSSGGQKHYSKSVLIASGLGTFEMQPLAVEGSKAYEERIHYTIQNLSQYEGKRAVVISDSRVGIDWALALEKVAKDVHLINHGSEFKAVYEQDIEILEQSSVTVHKETKVERVEGRGGQLENVVISNGKKLNVDDILVYEGLKIDKSLYGEWGLTTDKGRLPVQNDMGTDRPGIFAAGDAVVYPHKTMLIASGFSEAMTAVNGIKKYLDPKAKSQVYSTVIYKHAEK